MSQENKTKPTICAAPWKLLHLSPQGEVTSCFESSAVLGNIEDESLEEIWNGKPFQNLRAKMLDAQRPEQCQKCFVKEQAIEGQSIRTVLNHRFDFDEIEAEKWGVDPTLKPLQLDLSFSNHCNLKCRMCGPIYSSSWVKELEESNAPNARVYSLDSKSFNAQILPLISSKVQRLVLTGGEPFLDEKNERIIEELAKIGNYDCVIEFNTNGTFVSKMMVKLLVKFKNVRINFSFDDFGKRFELLRKGASWEQVQKNVRLLRSVLPHARLMSYSTITVFNIESFLSYIDEVTNKNLFKIEEITLHYLSGPSYYSVNILPENKKREIEQLYLHYMKTKLLACFDWKDCQHLILQMKMVLNFMTNSSAEGTVKELIEECRSLDKVRGEDVFELFPHLKEL
jgi:radical SAM protein with 4Fe4S-binding SPASM domain